MATTYQDAVKLLTSIGKFHISLGLERISSILNLLDNPQDKLSCIHVAGTNGKGSVCAILSSILSESGKKVGLYSSPHIFKYTERIKINHQDISDNDFTKYVFEISNLADKNKIDLTEFEILTAVMFKYFADKNVDVVVLETGLGGRYDATNIIKKNLCSIITHIDLDHTERLGNTLDKIAYEKAGIIKPNCPCIVTEGREVFYDIANELNSMLIITNPYSDTTNLALKGTYQEENLALALCAIKTIFPKIPEFTIQEGLKKVQHPCRFQYIENKNLIIDGGHNPNGIKALSESLDKYFPNSKRRFIFGCLRNKDYKTMVQTLFKSGDEVLFYHFNHKNSCNVEELQKVCPVNSKELTSKTVIDFNDGHLNIICGSFYMISELVQLLEI
jgi:dihydrofolate synthase/folylpolyglutamate synthase